MAVNKAHRKRRVIARSAPGKRMSPNPKAKWTVMVYMAAVRDDQQTERAAIRDLREMERVGSTASVRIVVQLDRDWPGTPERYVVYKGVSERAPDDSEPNRIDATRQTRPTISERSSGHPRALGEFLKWSRMHHEAERYLLVLWGHSFGLGFGRDHGDPLTLLELRTALEEFKRQGKLDLLGANACAMSYAEAAFELKDVASCLVAPEITMPFSGWPYAAILQRMGQRLQKGKRSLTAEELGRLIVDEFMSSFRRRGVALTLLNLPKADLLSNRIESLARALRPRMSDPALSALVADAFLDSARGDVRPLVDLSDLCTQLEKTGEPAIVDSAGRLRQDLEHGPRKLILRHEFDPDFEGLHGLGIFAPAVTSASDLQRLELDKETYEALALMDQSGQEWSKLVYTDLAEVLEPMNDEITELVRESGASSRDDREGVGQLLLSAKRSFDRLDVAIRNARDVVLPSRPGGHDSNSGTGGRRRPADVFLRLFIEDPPANETRPSDKSRPVSPAQPADLSENATTTLREIELALASTERTLRRVITNGNVGLGDIKPGFGDIKPGFGDIKPGFGDIKPGFGDIKPGFGDIKPGFGDIKPGFGDIKPGFGSAMTSEGAVLTEDMQGVVALVSAIAASLSGLEVSLSRLERIVAGPRSGTPMGVDETRQRTLEAVDGAFRDLEDRLIVARETCFWALRHPMYGLGPGDVLSSSADRRHIAAVGGLNTRVLQLL
jgi:hypothetical protein